MRDISKLRTPGRTAVLGALAAAIAVTASAAVMAQPPRGGGRPGGPGMFGGGRGMFGGRNMTAAVTPVPALAAELKLTGSQQQQIKQIQDKFRKDMGAMLPPGGPGGPPGPGGPGGPGGRPRPGGPGGPGGRMGGMGQLDIAKIQSLAQHASTSVEAVLTPQQRRELPGALKEISAMRSAGIPLDTLGALKLTSSQKSRIAAISDQSQKDLESRIKAANGDFRAMGPVFQQSRDKTRMAVDALLTQPQKGVIAKYEKEHPRRGFQGGGFRGGGGGRRGGPGGGPGGPPRS